MSKRNHRARDYVIYRYHRNLYGDYDNRNYLGLDTIEYVNGNTALPYYATLAVINSIANRECKKRKARQVLTFGEALKEHPGLYCDADLVFRGARVIVDPKMGTIDVYTPFPADP